ncbi:MAG TPA: TRAP transporter fused permease subunit [Thermodesulfobacteriota bacterium]|nr:TRAP transporter fused permease subunit [Thermodesulfobacteriota bacterium]
MKGSSRWLQGLTLLSLGWLIFQFYIIFYPQIPLIQKPVHVAFALAFCFMAFPFSKGVLGKTLRPLDWVFVILSCLMGIYFILDSNRILNRMTFIDDVLLRDYIGCILLTMMLLEGTRRTTGNGLVYVLIFFVLYAIFGPWFPGWLKFKGMDLSQFTEVLFLSDNGIFGIPTGVSVDYLFYFVLFGSLFGASGGGQLFTDLGLKVTSKTKGGAAKASVISSGLFGMISGSAVANVAVDGIFTIPLMKKSGYSAAEAGGIEAITSTGGQLMPPVMGAGAFIMAEILGVPYFDVAKAAALPAVAFYLSLFLIIDFKARRTGIGTLSEEEAQIKINVLPRLYLLLPVVLLIYFIANDYSVTWAIVWTIVALIIVSLFRRETRLTPSRFIGGCLDGVKQATGVAVPIASIGIIIGVTVQSGLAMKFSSMLMDITGGNVILTYFMVILGCIVLGMGLPTVAAYMIGAILFVPPLINFGLTPLAAHLFVFYYSILSMVTPPVALAAYAAAGLANESVSKTGWAAFRLSLVCFLIPFVFIYDPGMLLKGPMDGILIASLTTVLGIVAWAAFMARYFMGPLSTLERFVFLLVSLGLIAPTIAGVWIPSIISFFLLIGWRFFNTRKSAK